MRASTSDSVRHWKWVLGVLEAIVVFGCVYGMALKILWYFNQGDHPHFSAVYILMSRFLRPMGWLFSTALVGLLLGSPLLLRPLRARAARAWLIGVGALVWALLLLFF